MISVIRVYSRLDINSAKKVADESFELIKEAYDNNLTHQSLLTYLTEIFVLYKPDEHKHNYYKDIIKQIFVKNKGPDSRNELLFNI
jgi:coenzyme F420-reducing hydrogenase alpha subunit